MRSKLFLSILAGLWAVAFTQTVKGETLTIVVNNVGSDQGSVMFQVIAGEDQFNGKGAAIAQTQRAASEGEMRVIMADLPPGEYAFRVMHDENSNGELDANFVGMPTEPWAMSNNAKGNFGPPKWRDAKFTLEGDTTQAVNLN